jgi:pimeloyl-ACP methyl ester carboxylesterase
VAGWSEEIVWIKTDDGINHDGVVIRPTGSPTGTAVVWMHGYTGNFSEPHQIRIGRYLAERGHLFVSGDNRGHHLGAGLGERDGQLRIGGGWWELVSEAWLDIKAWLDFAATTLAPRRLVLAGHSYGAVKVTWYQGERQDPRLAGLISASGPVRPPSKRPELGEPLARVARVRSVPRRWSTAPSRWSMSTAWRVATRRSATCAAPSWRSWARRSRGSVCPRTSRRCGGTPARRRAPTRR